MKNDLHSKEYYTKSPSFHDQSMSCICWHPYYNHQLCIGKCDAESCECKEFKQGSVEIWDYIDDYNENENDERKYKGGLF